MHHLGMLLVVEKDFLGLRYLVLIVGMHFESTLNMQMVNYIAWQEDGVEAIIMPQMQDQEK